MPIDLTEKRLLEAIDGNQCIGDIVGEGTSDSSSANSRREIARSFFERLGQYDQVVFDTSQLRKLPANMSEMVQIA